MPDSGNLKRTVTVIPRGARHFAAAMLLLAQLVGCGEEARVQSTDDLLGCAGERPTTVKPANLPGLTLASQDPAAASDAVARQDTLHALRVVLNVPGFRIDVHEGDSLRATYSVAVGTPRYRTPTGEFTIDWLEWNPWWYPPSSEWARDEKPTPPGPANPMGRVKIHVTGMVLIHGTPDRQSIGSAASHACIRMLNEDVVALASVLQRSAATHLEPARLDAVAAGARTVRVRFDAPVPVSIVYELVEVRDTMLLVHRDIYRRAGSRYAELIREALARHEVLPEPPAPMVDELARRAELGSLAIPLREVIGGLRD
jgi:hypothetical protein